MGKVLAIYRSIRSGAFNPDLDAAMRVLQVANALISSEGRPEDGNAGQDEFIAEPMDRADGESDGSASDGAEAGPLELPGLPAVRAPFAEVTETIQREALEVWERKIGLTEDTLQGLLDNSYNTFGRLAFAVSATPTTLTDEAVDAWIDGLGMRPSGFQKASLRRLLFEGVSMAIEEVRARVEPSLEGHPKKLAAAERLDRQAKQERSLGGLVFTPETRPANACVDLCVEMLETGVLQYHVPSKWISRAQEAQCLKRDNSINIDADNNLKIATKSADLWCDVSSEMRLRQAWGRRSLAFDLANLASFREMEEHVQFLFSVLQRVQPKGFQGVQLSQIIEADKQMFILASNNLMGRLTASPGAAPALDAEISRLSRSPELMQYLAPLQVPQVPNIPHKPWKGDPKGDGKNRSLPETLPAFGGEDEGTRQTGHVFSTCGIFIDGCTPLHKDTRNAQWPNAIFRLSDFQNGGLWIEGSGDDVRELNGQELTGSVDALRLEAANQLHALTYRIWRKCIEDDVVVSLENPVNSYLWDILRAYEPAEPKLHVLPKLTRVIFDLCCHGGARPKRTQLLCTAACFDRLHALCQNDHPHKPWGQIVECGTVRYATKDEAAYPQLFAARYAACLADHALAAGYSLTPQPRVKDLSLAMLGRQTKRHAPLVSEYKQVLHMPAASFTQQPHLKLLRNPIGGGNVRASDLARAQPLVSNTPTGGTIPEAPGKGDVECKVGVYRTPGEFVEEAKKVNHPVDSSNPLEKVTLQALQENLLKDPKLISLRRNLAIAKVKQEIHRLRDAEEKLHNSMDPSVAKVMKGKSILAFEALLKSEGYDDMGVISFLKEGVRLVGTSECPACYDYKFVPAWLSEDELFETAAARRDALLSKFERVDPEEAKILKDATDNEVALGFLEGPYYEKSEVSSRLKTERWTIIRRFVLLQGADQKPRPIDNCLESQLNAGYSGRVHPAAKLWKGKCLDLSKAYKQLAVHPDHRSLAAIAVRESEGRDALYLSNSLMFGSTAAVYAFNRVSRALWYLVNRLLCLPSGVFYDDFPLLCPAGSANNADESASALLDLLGWAHAKTGAKGRPFAEQFEVLGMSLNLESVSQGEVSLSNKQGRIERIIDRLQEISLKGEIKRHDAQVLQGLLQYASGFYAGRSLKHASHILARVVGTRTPEYCLAP
ncbi:unnamed protein product [Symbiodinium sp. CCMP2456]|nr:unnamed protein product [Symbiodinium sp. CCMP2456]